MGGRGVPPLQDTPAGSLSAAPEACRDSCCTPPSKGSLGKRGEQRRFRTRQAEVLPAEQHREAGKKEKKNLAGLQTSHKGMKRTCTHMLHFLLLHSVYLNSNSHATAIPVCDLTQLIIAGFLLSESVWKLHTPSALQEFCFRECY